MTSQEQPSDPEPAGIVHERVQTEPQVYSRCIAGPRKDYLLEAARLMDRYHAAAPTPSPKKAVTRSQVLNCLLLSLIFPMYWIELSWCLGSWMIILALSNGGHHAAAGIVYIVLVVVSFIGLMVSAKASKK